MAIWLNCKFLKTVILLADRIDVRPAAKAPIRVTPETYYADISKMLVVEAKRDLRASIRDRIETVLYGALTGPAANSFDDAWVALLDAYSGEVVRDVPVDETGHFVIGDLFEPVNCILVVCQNGRVAGGAARSNSMGRASRSHA